MILWSISKKIRLTTMEFWTKVSTFSQSDQVTKISLPSIKHYKQYLRSIKPLDSKICNQSQVSQSSMPVEKTCLKKRSKINRTISLLMKSLSSKLTIIKMHQFNRLYMLRVQIPCIDHSSRHQANHLLEWLNHLDKSQPCKLFKIAQ